MKESNSLSRELEFCIKDIKSRIDSRIIAFNVRPEIKKREIVLHGFVHAPQQREALLDALAKIPGIKRRRIALRSRLTILSQRKIRFAQVNTPWTDLRLEPKKKSASSLKTPFPFFVCRICGEVSLAKESTVPASPRLFISSRTSPCRAIHISR